MGLSPNIARRRRNIGLKQCPRCKETHSIDNFAPTKSLFYPDGALPLCDGCVDELIAQHDGDWEFIDKLCQYADVPFIPKQWTDLYEMNPIGTFHTYANMCATTEYDSIGWSDYYQAYKDLKTRDRLETELPKLNEEYYKDLKARWGQNYDYDALDYLENLYNGMLSTQNVNGALSTDQAIKLCKISYEIDNRIREGSDFDKLLASYDKLVKIAEFTPKNVKNINDFDSVGELIKWLERRGWRNKFYDGATRDIVDETIKNIQAFNQRLYTNESGIGEEITRRIEALHSVAQLEQQASQGGIASDYYGTDIHYDMDAYEEEGYKGLFEGESDTFSADLGGGSDG